MLLEFTVENFRSFRGKTTLSMIASSDNSLSHNLSRNEVINDKRTVNSAVIYGANASGKSNMIIAMTILRNFIINSHAHQKGMPLNHQPFAFDEDHIKKPTRFTISFIQENIRYDYSMSYDKERIVEERLNYYPNGKISMIFSRTNNEYKFNTDKTEQEVISRRTLENALYLSTSVQFNYSKTTPAFTWFNDRMIAIDNTDYNALLNRAIGYMNHNKKAKKMMVHALQIADLGITGVEGKIKKIPLQKLSNNAPPQILGIMTMVGGSEALHTDLRFKHKISDEDGKTTEMELAHIYEAEGTRKLFCVLGPIIDILHRGGLLVIDELDAKLHHDISRWLVSLFHAPEQNRNGAQLVFNTHDQQLLDQSLFRRDQIWFTEKDGGSGASELYSLAEFGERRDRDILKAYQLGRYGAIPAIVPSKVV
jgi:AAA15 family ATPase/GTPase